MVGIRASWSTARTATYFAHGTAGQSRNAWRSRAGRRRKQPDDEIVFFQAGGMVFGLWTALGGHGAPGIELAHNVRTPEEVDAVLASAVRAGATIARPAALADWGGYTGAFADPDGYVWEVAHNPGWTLAADGSVASPKAGDRPPAWILSSGGHLPGRDRTWTRARLEFVPALDRDPRRGRRQHPDGGSLSLRQRAARPDLHARSRRSASDPGQHPLHDLRERHTRRPSGRRRAIQTASSDSRSRPTATPTPASRTMRKTT